MGIYAVLGQDKKSFDYSLQAARLGSRDSILRLAESETYLPVLAKYKFICCLLRWGNYDQSQAAEWLALAKQFSKEDLHDFLHSVPSVSIDCLRLSHLLDIDPDLAIVLFKNARVLSHLNENEKQDFLIQCAQRCPKHKWVGEAERLTTLYHYFQDDALPIAVRTTYFILGLLNNTLISKDMAKVGSELLEWSEKEIDDQLSVFVENYDEKTLERTTRVIKLYQYLLNLERPTVKAWPLSLDEQGFQQLFDLIHQNEMVANRHRLEGIIQEAAFAELGKSTSACEKAKERETLLKETKVNPLYISHHTFCGNFFRLFPHSEKRQAEKQAKAEEKQQRKGLRKGGAKEV